MTHTTDATESVEYVCMILARNMGSLNDIRQWLETPSTPRPDTVRALNLSPGGGGVESGFELLLKVSPKIWVAVVAEPSDDCEHISSRHLEATGDKAVLNDPQPSDFGVEASILRIGLSS